jgi:hypothetical protein
MKIQYQLYAMLISMTMFVSACGSDNDDGDDTPKKPTVTSFSPLYGLPGSSINITGTNFSTTAADNTVDINGIEATVTAATATTLTVTIPDEAETGNITVATGGGEAASSDEFEVLIDIPRTGLVAFYKLDGNGNDASGNALNGTVTGAAASTSRFSKENKSLKFDGVDDKVNMGNPTKLQISNTITVAGWVNIDDYKSNNSMQALVTKIYFDPAQGGNPARGYRVAQDHQGGGTPSFYAGSYSTMGLPLSTYAGNALSLDTWIFFALIIEGKNFKFYHNEALVNNVDITHGVNILNDGTLGDFVLGMYGDGFAFNGSLDDITVYNRALTDVEITTLYNQTITKY